MDKNLLKFQTYYFSFYLVYRDKYILKNVLRGDFI